jgi:hypothetical protein
MGNKYDKILGEYREDDASKYFVENGNTLELWWKGVKVQQWTYTAAPPVAGSPFGAWLGLWRTYAS